MQYVFVLALALAVAHGAGAAPHQCTFPNGDVVETQYSCEPAMVARFEKRLLEFYPEVRKINTSPDYILGLYTFAMAGCRGQFATMTPEEIGVNGEPFFPRAMLAAMVRAGREVMCPLPP